MTGSRRSPAIAGMKPPGDLMRFGQVVETLTQDIGPEGLSEILGTFLVDTRTRVDALLPLLDGRDSRALARCAHAIRGGAAIFGLQDLERAAQAVEVAAGLPESPGLPLLVDTLRAEYSALEPSLQAKRGEILADFRPSDPSEA